MILNEVLSPMVMLAVSLLFCVVFFLQYLSSRRTKTQLTLLKEELLNLQSQFTVVQKVSKGIGSKVNTLQIENRQLKLEIENINKVPPEVHASERKSSLNAELFDNPELDLKSLIGKSEITH